eukprot:375276-Rhodomonas_salina.2
MSERLGPPHPTHITPGPVSVSLRLRDRDDGRSYSGKGFSLSRIWWHAGAGPPDTVGLHSTQ